MKDSCYLPRTIESSILKASKAFKVVMLSGMRQVGKSRVFTALDKKRNNVSLRTLKARELANQSSSAFFKTYSPPLVIDEVQRAPNIFLSIKEEVDKSRQSGSIWLTCSQKISLMKGIVDGLPGRMIDFELQALSLYERQNKAFEQQSFIPRSGKQRGSLENLGTDKLVNILWQGSWPGMVDLDEDGRNGFFQEFLQDYIRKEVIVAFGIKEIEKFERFLAILARGIGQELRIGKLAKDCGIRPETVKSWLNVAEVTGLIFLLPPLYGDFGRKIVKTKRLYFSDPGIACWLLKLASPAALLQSPYSQELFKNFVIAEIRKSWLHNGKRPEFYFYRDSRQKEVDLLIRNGLQYHPIEIKLTNETHLSMVKDFETLRSTGVPLGQGALICTTDQIRILDANTTAISLWDI